MGVVGVVMAFFTVGYTLGVWTAGAVFRQRQRAYEGGPPAAPAHAPVIVLGEVSGLASRRP